MTCLITRFFCLSHGDRPNRTRFFYISPGRLSYRTVFCCLIHNGRGHRTDFEGQFAEENRVSNGKVRENREIVLARKALGGRWVGEILYWAANKSRDDGADTVGQDSNGSRGW